jgi:hypothetical protein
MDVQIFTSILTVLVALSGVLTTVGIFILRGMTHTIDKNTLAITTVTKDHNNFKENVAKNYYDKPEIEAHFTSFMSRAEQRNELILESINKRLTHLEKMSNSTESGISGLSKLLPEMVEAIRQVSVASEKPNA